MVAARHRHRGQQVLPQGRRPRRARARDQRAAGGAPHRAHHPRRRARQQGGYFATRRGRRRVRGRAVATCSSTRSARSTRRCGSTAASTTSTASKARAATSAWDAAPGAVQETADSYSRPQGSACFIQAVDDDLMSIFELVQERGARLQVRLRHRHATSRSCAAAGEALRRRHVVGADELPRGARSRRRRHQVGRHHAARGQDGVLDMDHPEIVDFIRWKVREEKKVAALIAAGYSSRLQRRRLPHRHRARTRTTRCACPTLHAGGRERRQVADDVPHHRRGARDASGARDLWRMIAEAAWQCADPGVQYDDTIQRWHTCPTRIGSTRRIRAPSTCSSTTRRAISRRST